MPGSRSRSDAQTVERITIVGAPTNVGIEPYDDGQPHRLDRAPVVVRRLGAVSALNATDAGDVSPQPYRDFARVPGCVRNGTNLSITSTSLRSGSGPPAFCGLGACGYGNGSSRRRSHKY